MYWLPHVLDVYWITLKLCFSDLFCEIVGIFYLLSLLLLLLLLLISLPLLLLFLSLLYQRENFLLDAINYFRPMSGVRSERCQNS